MVIQYLLMVFYLSDKSLLKANVSDINRIMYNSNAIQNYSSMKYYDHDHIFIFIDWGENQPDAKSENGKCAVYRPKTDSWDDVTCESKHFPVCQMNCESFKHLIDLVCFTLLKLFSVIYGPQCHMYY